MTDKKDENGNDPRDLCKACEANIRKEERERIWGELNPLFSANPDIDSAEIAINIIYNKIQALKEAK